MCVFGLGALAGLGGAAASGAAGALQTLATVASIGGTLYSGVTAYQTGKAQEAVLTQQAKTEAQLNAVQDQRQRSKMESAIAVQRGNIVASGIDLSSPTAVFLGQTAAQELSFESQAIRSGGQARVAELSNQAQLSRANASAGLLKGAIGAASDFLTMGPEVWPGLFRERQLA